MWCAIAMKRSFERAKSGSMSTQLLNNYSCAIARHMRHTRGDDPAMRRFKCRPDSHRTLFTLRTDLSDGSYCISERSRWNESSSGSEQLMKFNWDKLVRSFAEIWKEIAANLTAARFLTRKHSFVDENLHVVWLLFRFMFKFIRLLAKAKIQWIRVPYLSFASVFYWRSHPDHASTGFNYTINRRTHRIIARIIVPFGMKKKKNMMESDYSFV